MISNEVVKLHDRGVVGVKSVVLLCVAVAADSAADTVDVQVVCRLVIVCNVVTTSRNITGYSPYKYTASSMTFGRSMNCENGISLLQVVSSKYVKLVNFFKHSLGTINELGLSQIISFSKFVKYLMDSGMVRQLEIFKQVN